MSQEQHRVPSSLLMNYVECLYFEQNPLSTWDKTHHFQLELTSKGIALRPEATHNSKKRRTSPRQQALDEEILEDTYVIGWENILGAATKATQPVFNKNLKLEEQDFIIYGCISKGKLNKRATSTITTKTDPIERILVQWVFRYDGNGSKRVDQLVSMIQTLSDPRVDPKEMFSTASSPSSYHPKLPQRRFLVVINPVGGSGNASKIYQKHVEPLFEQSHIKTELVITNHQAHAQEIAQTLPLNQYDCIVSVGGDGLLSEIIQGLMMRPDWKNAIRQPLGVIPGGSGNGLSASVLSQAGEQLLPLNASYSITKGKPTDLDIASAQNSQGKTMYSFLSLEWAFIADVDIESEKFRRFGSLRFTISAVSKLLLSRKSFSGTVKYLEPPPPGGILPLKFQDLPDSRKGTNAPERWYLQGYHHQKEGQWKEIHGNFLFFWAMLVSHGASDAIVAPGIGLNDGFMHLVLMDADKCSRLELAKVLLALETGKHVTNPYVQVIKTRAWSLHVDNPNDLVCIDGEVFGGPDVQIEVHRGMARVLCLPPSPTTSSR